VCAHRQTKIFGIVDWVNLQMEYQGFEYTVVQTANPTGWKWTVRLTNNRTRSGIAFSRVSAIKLAQHAIEKSQKTPGGWKRRSEWQSGARVLR
jgi:hypothetical protein